MASDAGMCLRDYVIIRVIFSLKLEKASLGAL